MKSLISNIALLKATVGAGLITALFITIFITPVYKSKSIIDVSRNETESVSSSIVSSILPSSGSQDAFQVKFYLESQEASDSFRKRVNVLNLFSNDKITFFSKYKEKSRWNSFHDYFQNKINILVDIDSNTLIIETFGFTAADAKNINLHLVDMTANFFNRKSRLASLNARSSKICELYTANTGVLLSDEEINFPTDDGNVSQSSSANELLINKAEDYKNHCLDQLETNDAEIESFIKIPAYELKNINAEASKRIITDLYQKSMDTVSEADYMEIIAEPMISEKTESKRTFLLTILVMACLFTVLLGTKIIFRLSDEFTL